MEYLNAEDVAELLGISKDTLAGWRVEKKGPPYIKVGSRVRYEAEAVRQWLHAQTVETDNHK